MYVPPRPSGIEARVPSEPPDWYLEAERTPILSPTVEGHTAVWVNESGESGEWSAIECECGWREFCTGFDAGAIADCAYGDHLDGLT